MIIFCVELGPFLLTINLDIASSFNIFSSLIFVFKCNGITIRINEISIFFIKKTIHLCNL